MPCIEGFIFIFFQEKVSGAPSGVNVAPLGLSMEPVVPPPAPPVDTTPPAVPVVAEPAPAAVPVEGGLSLPPEAPPAAVHSSEGGVIGVFDHIPVPVPWVKVWLMLHLQQCLWVKVWLRLHLQQPEEDIAEPAAVPMGEGVADAPPAAMPMGEGVADAPPPPVPVEEDVIPLVDLPEGVSLGWV